MLTAIAAYINNRESSHRTEYVLQATNLELYANQLSQTAALAVSGDSKAFEDMAAAHQSLQTSANILDKGSSTLAPTSGKARTLSGSCLSHSK